MPLTRGVAPAALPSGPGSWADGWRLLDPEDAQSVDNPATFYGLLIAIAGCLRGFQCGNSSSAVGDAATQAVVMSIVMVVAACGMFAVVFNYLGI